MNATTIKLDAQLHSTIKRLKPGAQSLTAYVRELVGREEKRKALEAAAEKYDALLSRHKDEAAWLAAWESAPLASTPKTRRS